jgi:hypothetical protein
MSHSPSITRVNITHANTTKAVAFYPGLDPTEIIELLQSVFNISDTVLGFQTKVSIYLYWPDSMFYHIALL